MSRNAIQTDYTSNTATVTRGPFVTVTTFDGFGRPTGTSDAVGVQTSIKYDAEGRKKFESLPFVGTATGDTFSYDGLGRIQRRTHEDNTFIDYAYGFEGGLATVLITDENTHATMQRWGGFGSPADARLTSVTDADGKTWNYEYNVLGKPTRVLAPDGVERRFRYDDAAHPGLMTSETHPESGTVQYTPYDGAGNLKQKQDANGNVFAYAYDGNDRLSTITTGARVIRFTYESDTDNRMTASVGNVGTQFHYDAGGRLDKRTDSVLGSAPQTQTFDYDGNDNLKTITYASTGRRIQYQYDAGNRVTSVSDVTDGTTKVFASAFTYHPSGAITSYTTSNNVVHTIAFDSRYRPSHINARDLDLTYAQYDAAGNVTSILDSRAGMNQNFAYDNLDRLTNAVGVYGSVLFNYDAHGNRVTNGASSYQYDAGFHLIHQNNDSFTYDNNGNLTTSTIQGGTFTYHAG